MNTQNFRSWRQGDSQATRILVNLKLLVFDMIYKFQSTKNKMFNNKIKLGYFIFLIRRQIFKIKNQSFVSYFNLRLINCVTFKENLTITRFW